MSKKDGEKKHSYFDVERFRRVMKETSRPMGRLGRVFRRFTWFLDSFQGFFIPMMIFGLVYAIVGVVLVGAILGPIGFLVLMVLLIGGVGFFAEKKVGKSLQFGDYSVWRRTIAATAAFALVIGLLYLIIFVSKLGARIFG